MSQYHVFETAIGWAGVAWTEKGLIGAYLPESDPEIVRTAFAQKFPGAAEATPPPAIAKVVAQIVALMHGEKVDMSDAPLDWGRVPEFNAKVYEITLVPCHRVTAANGKLGGFTARGGAQTKLKLLAIEGAQAAAQTDLFGDSL
ncbi:MAG: methylated-DNA--[protein]-cysteine S-methyltransferase [Alphaproteobacteria bacterium]|nr:MAG: methylated-DNA--[protein]-cysteine S-methyltransferase [Alphaproteobacteria bacterium]